MVKSLGRSLGDFVWLPRGFPSIRCQNRPLQENLQGVLETYRIPCIYIGYSQEKKMGVGGDGRLREGGWWIEWIKKMPRITQKSKPKLGDGRICSKSLEKFPWEIMKWLRV